MQFHIDGRFQADVRHETEGWTVQAAEPSAHSGLKALAISAGLDANDIDTYLDALFEESVEGLQPLKDWGPDA